MNIINNSRKIIGINGEPLLPGAGMELPEGYETHPAIADYLARGIITDAENPGPAEVSAGISDFERAKIAEEAIAQYKRQQEAETAAQAEREAEIKAVKTMKKAELLTKAAGMGLAVEDDDGIDALRDKIVAALSQ